MKYWNMCACVCADGVASDLAFSGCAKCGFGFGYWSGFLHDDCHLSHTEVNIVNQVTYDPSLAILLILKVPKEGPF